MGITFFAQTLQVVKRLTFRSVIDSEVVGFQKSPKNSIEYDEFGCGYSQFDM